MSKTSPLTDFPSANRIKISKALVLIGFKPPFEFYFWHNDGWYVDSEELDHHWIGQNSGHALERLKKQTKEDVLHKRIAQRTK